MKTAIQLLDEYLSEKLNVKPTEDIIESAKLDVYAEIGNLIGELLEKEKAQIVEAFTKGQLDIIGAVDQNIPKIIQNKINVKYDADGKTYYTETFTQTQFLK